MTLFDRFVAKHQNDLKRIARHTRGEYTFDDVVNEAWLMAETVSAHLEQQVDLADAGFCDALLRRLYQHLVRYTERQIRHAVRLDHSPSADAVTGDVHPLMRSLSNHGDDPLTMLLCLDEPPPEGTSGNALHSVASSYLVLLGHFGQRMRRVADYLLISLAHAYRRCALARHLTSRQHALRLAPPASIDTLKPWRRRRQLRIPTQLQFDFDDELPLALCDPEPMPETGRTPDFA